MTSPRRFDQELPAIFAALYPIATPDYRDELVQRIAVTPQRPAWTFIERWLPVDITAQRVAGPRIPMRQFAVLALVGLLVAAALAAYVGSQRRLPDPFGLAANGSIAYSVAGDILIRNDLAAEPTVVLGGTTDDHDPWFSPDGSRLAFVRTIEGKDYLMTVRANGSDVRQVLSQPLVDPFIVWSPDSRSFAFADSVRGIRALSIVLADGSGSRSIDTGGVVPGDPSWRPPTGEEILFRGQAPDGSLDLYVVASDGTGLRALGLPSERLFGPDWDVTGAAWSPDGSRIAYNVVEFDPLSGVNHFRVHVIQPDGTGDVALPGPAPEVMEAWPVWSPDGTSILVHRWTWKSAPDGGRGWLAILPADGSAPARAIGPEVAGGEDTGLIKTWSPDGTHVLVRAGNTLESFSIVASSGDFERLDWNATNLPDWQRIAP